MRLVILGGPGAGKGTQAQHLCRHFEIPLISTGEMLRQAIAAQTPLGQQVQAFVEKGELVPDETMIQLMRQRLLQADTSRGWLLEGHPRTAFQAEELDFLLEDLNQHLNQAIWLDAPDNVLMRRSIARQRSDDTPEVIQHRIESFRDYTMPMLDYYEHRDRLLKINSNQSIEQVHQEILQHLQ
ncbi:adenylate kinase [Trichocoleus desertorum]|uniref:Adenylate kinase n=1 Tax=Trichocoleus desertorum GB2-A4 TaxID=2933944 RepID=A0ABV0J8A3_9CYAN|nr:adenylate kinase [Trichocoleus sp. FACHB-46]